MLEVHDIRVSYGSLEVLHSVSLQVREREIVALLGANGAGKTTAISAVSGLLPLNAGRIEFRLGSNREEPTRGRKEHAQGGDSETSKRLAVQGRAESQMPSVVPLHDLIVGKGPSTHVERLAEHPEDRVDLDAIGRDLDSLARVR